MFQMSQLDHLRLVQDGRLGGLVEQAGHFPGQAAAVGQYEFHNGALPEIRCPP